MSTVDGTPESNLARHLPALLERAGVDYVELDALMRPNSFRGAEVSPRAQEITGPAREEHRRRGFGFWEFVISGATAADAETRQGLLAGALRHNSSDSIRMQMSRVEFSDHLAAGRLDALPPRSMISLCSPVVLSDHPTGDWHLPMLDLGVPVGLQGLEAATDAITALDQQGLVVSSGRSYHFYGATPLRHPDLVKFLARAQLLSPLVDSRWVSHQLLDGRCGLRISTDQEKNQTPLQVVASLG